MIKRYLVELLLLTAAGFLLWLRFSGKVRPAQMSLPMRLALWWSAFLIALGPLTIALFKLLRQSWGYDASPLSVALYGGAVLVAALIAAWLAHWVTGSDS